MGGKWEGNKWEGDKMDKQLHIGTKLHRLTIIKTERTVSTCHCLEGACLYVQRHTHITPPTRPHPFHHLQIRDPQDVGGDVGLELRLTVLQEC